MEKDILNYKSRKGVHVPKDVKEYILKRIKEGGKTAAEIAEEHGITRSAVYRWLKEETGGGSDPVIAKLQKENHILKQLIAELSLKIRESEKRGW